MYVRLCHLNIPREKNAKLSANNGDPDQTAHSVASDLGLHYLLIAFLGVSRLKWIMSATQPMKYICTVFSMFQFVSHAGKLHYTAPRVV